MLRLLFFILQFLTNMDQLQDQSEVNLIDFVDESVFQKAPSAPSVSQTFKYSKS